MEQTATRKNAEVSAVLLENIKLVNRLRRSENLLRQKEELADGLSLIDFEQLKIENQTFTDKIEERNEDVNKLKKKITTIVQMLTHLKEKMAFTQADNVQLREELSQLDGDVSALRDSLPTLKVERDKLRKHNITLQHQNGLRGNKMLLRDYETKVVGDRGVCACIKASLIALTISKCKNIKDLAKALQTRVDALRASYNKLASECNSAKKKLQKSNAASFLSGSGPVSRDAPHFNATSLSSGGI